jgi:hypothetical protein
VEGKRHLYLLPHERLLARWRFFSTRNVPPERVQRNGPDAAVVDAATNVNGILAGVLALPGLLLGGVGSILVITLKTNTVAWVGLGLLIASGPFFLLTTARIIQSSVIGRSYRRSLESRRST